MNWSKNMYQPIEGLHDEEPVADGQARHARGYRLSEDKDKERKDEERERKRINILAWRKRKKREERERKGGKVHRSTK